MAARRQRKPQFRSAGEAVNGIVAGPNLPGPPLGISDTPKVPRIAKPGPQFRVRRLRRFQR